MCVQNSKVYDPGCKGYRLEGGGKEELRNLVNLYKALDDLM